MHTCKRRSAILSRKSFHLGVIVTGFKGTNATLTGDSVQSTIDGTRQASAASFPRAKKSAKGEDYMNNSSLKLYIKLQNLAKREQGQELVEYALICALIALACITGINSVATAVNSVFTNLSNSLG